MAIHDRLRNSVASCLVLLLTACGKPPTSMSRTYVVAYRVIGSAGITFDSVRYEDAQGTSVRVVAPASNWSVAFSASSGAYVQASAWALASAGGASATLRVMWTESGVSTASDSSTATTGAPGRFALSIPRRQI
jgi:hypothetical protein